MKMFMCAEHGLAREEWCEHCIKAAAVAALVAAVKAMRDCKICGLFGGLSERRRPHCERDLYVALDALEKTT